MYKGYRTSSLDPIWVLIGLNLLFFLPTLVPVIRYSLISSFGLLPADVLARPWIIVTSLFLHAGMGHIMTNMFTLYFFGRYLSTSIGERRFLTVYFLGGILGNIFYILLAPPLSIAIGASGAVFAVGGVLAVLRSKTKVFVFPIPAPLPLWIAVIGGFLIISFFPSVAWQAHLGGLTFGLVIGYYFKKRKRTF